MGRTARCGLLLLLQALLAPTNVQPRRARGRPPGGVVRTDALGSQAWEAEASLSASECASIRSASGVAKDGSSMVDYAEQSGAANTVPQEVRSTQLQWLGVGRPDIDALREKLFSVAKRASHSAGWTGHGRLHRLQNLQLGTYLAEEGGHYTWHPGMWSSCLCVFFPASEEAAATDAGWPEPVAPQAQTRLLTVVVQLSAPGDYRGGQLQVGVINASDAQGTVVIFPSHQMHRVTPITLGRRVSLVGWVAGEVRDEYWTDKQALMRRTIDAEQTIPADLTYNVLQSFTTRMLEQQNWQQVLVLTARQAELTDELYASDLGKRGSYHAERLGLALLRYALAAANIGTVHKVIAQKAWASCERASRLLREPETAVQTMRSWEELIYKNEGYRPRPAIDKPRPMATGPACCEWPGHPSRRLEEKREHVV